MTHNEHNVATATAMLAVYRANNGTCDDDETDIKDAVAAMLHLAHSKKMIAEEIVDSALQYLADETKLCGECGKEHAEEFACDDEYTETKAR